MAKIYIDGDPYDVDPDKNLLHVCLSLGFDLPYFCWHPAMGSVGACRQCAVKQFKDEKDTRGKIVMACMTPAADGARISIQDPETVNFRASVIEWLMVNHPHDCPVCDEGSECHLQDMTVMTGHVYRRYRFKKRTYRNQYLGPLINHEMNRCIQCYRCVRFYQDYAGGHDLDVFGAHDHVYFGRHEDGVLESEFSGNLVEVCPTGVFTDKTLKQHYTRKWDLQTAPSVCVHCSLGCNTIPGERYGKLRRILNGYNRDVNGYFLCDRGRFGYDFVNNDQRIRQPLIRRDRNEMVTPTTKEDVLLYLEELLADGAKVAGIGSPRASLEANFALRSLVGSGHFFAGVSDRTFRLVAAALKILQESPIRSPSLHEVELADAAFILGEDLTNTAPMLDYALRQTVRQQPMEMARKLGISDWDDASLREAIQQEKGPLFIATPASTKLDEIASKAIRAAPEDLARLGFAVASALDPNAPSVPDLSTELRSLAEEIAKALKGAQYPVVISGTSCGSEAIIQAAANVAWALSLQGSQAQICFTMPECNSLGLGLIGGESLESALPVMETGEADVLIILENDLYRQADPFLVDSILNAARHVVVIDHLENASISKADIVLPAATFAEGDGTLVNNEGRAQRFFQVFMPAGDVQESWRWLRDMMVAARRTEASAWQNLDDIENALSQALPIFAPVPFAAHPSGLRIAGQKIPRQPHRYSGRTAILTNINVHEPKPPDDPDTTLAFSMEGFKGRTPAGLIPRYWSPGWNSVQALNKFQNEVGGRLQGVDPGQRLIEPAQPKELAYFDKVPNAFQPRQNDWRIVPLYHIFGSEELSILAPWIAELAPKPYLALNPEDADLLRASEGSEIWLHMDGIDLSLPVKILPTLPAGIAGLPAGLPGMQYLSLPSWGRLSLEGAGETEGKG